MPDHLASFGIVELGSAMSASAWILLFTTQEHMVFKILLALLSRDF